MGSLKAHHRRAPSCVILSHKEEHSIQARLEQEKGNHQNKTRARQKILTVAEIAKLHNCIEHTVYNALAQTD
jgi:hypothetical protein